MRFIPAIKSEHLSSSPINVLFLYPPRNAKLFICISITLFKINSISSFDTLEELQSQRDFINTFKSELTTEKLEKLSEKDLLGLINFPISKYYYSIIGGNQNETQANIYHLNQLKFDLYLKIVLF